MRDNVLQFGRPSVTAAAEDLDATTWQTIQVGETYEGAGFRCHRYRDALRLTDTTNAGKRGRVCDRVSLDAYGQDGALSDVCATIRGAASYAEALAALTAWVDATTGGLTPTLYARPLKAIEVPPAGFKPVALRNEGMALRVDWDGWCLSDLTDLRNEPKTMNGRGSGLVSAAKVRAVVAARPELASASYHEVHTAIRDAGVCTHSWCAMD